ncbi:uncharacterized protein APUU_21799S [Aspergillus puulaauensis]|uniref:Suppressor protein SRP40 n=1 Tax=Aspergillus puulaauensis TaxID=1220207 RepID=A0A7R7XGZ5_9EURO|nr:uncharacterized protein APUU_21799S [Aspergillus puulaauensis]BCS21367.1 hypothetical protein APUU_21799S [Aspergillus puulaauensis]
MTSQSQATIRLHITPLNPELLSLVLPPSVRSLATDVSFHNLPTFPENNYGYVTLPEMEAGKVKKKLNGSILKGRKFKVESARQQKRKSDEGEDQNIISSDKSSSGKKLKKRKAEDTVLEGYELPSDRKVKRGWTESSNDKTERRKKEKRSKDKQEKRSKTQLKSKYTEKEECLFQTKVPPNRSGSTDEKSKKQSKKSKASPDMVVHEFSQTTTHPTFLRSNDGGSILTSAFEDGKGWVDETGTLREPASENVRKDQYRPGQVIGHKEKPKYTTVKPNHNDIEPKRAESTESEDWTSSSGSTSELDTTDSEDDASVSSSSSRNSEGSSMDSPPKQQHQLSESDESEEEQQSGAEPEASFGEKYTSANIQQQPTGEVHPLEALFKKPADQKKPDSDPPAQFSFFGQDADSEEEGTGNIAPLTPFTKGDLQGRGTRSAAPTPDTSQVTRTINWNTPEDSDNIGEEYLVTDSPVPRSVASSKIDSDFAKWFWENRGDNNRAWKKRRRDAAKEHRQRENRRKGMKGKS